MSQESRQTKLQRICTVSSKKTKGTTDERTTSAINSNYDDTTREGIKGDAYNLSVFSEFKNKLMNSSSTHLLRNRYF